MNIDINELAKTVAQSLDLSKFKGDVVAVKVVEYQIGNIEAGGIGIQTINHGNDRNVPSATSNRHIKANPDDVQPMKDERGEALMQKLVAANLIDESWQPVGLTGAERGVLAQQIAERLNIRETWSVFGNLWGMKPESLRAAFNKALNQRKSIYFIEKIQKALS